ncbi:MAG: type II toxin-antitoxin system VapC family toxin [Beijerinckiaceae bacterium]
MSLIVDASVAACWFLSEPETRDANEVIRRKAIICAPELIFVECASALAKRIRGGSIALEDATLAIRELRRFIPDVISTEKLLPDALSIAAALQHSVYDCVYLALARQRENTVLTLDRNLLAKTKGTAYAGRAMHLTDWVKS